MEILRILLPELIQTSVRLFKLIGLIVIILSGIQGLVNFIRRDFHTSVKLSQGLVIGMEFILGSRLLPLITTWNQEALIPVATMTGLWTVMTLVILLEKKMDRNREESHTAKVPEPAKESKTEKAEIEKAEKEKAETEKAETMAVSERVEEKAMEEPKNEPKEEPEEEPEEENTEESR